MERLIFRLAQRYLRIFLKDFTSSSLSLKLIKGETKIRDLDLNEDALNELIGYPFVEIQSAKISALHLRMSIKRIKKEPIVVCIDEIVVNATERMDPMPLTNKYKKLLGLDLDVPETDLEDLEEEAIAEALNGNENMSDRKRKKLLAKRQKIRNEARKRREKKEKEKEKEKNKPKPKAKAYGFIDKVVDGLRVEIKKITMKVQLLGPKKTSSIVETTPPALCVVLKDIVFAQTDNQWKDITDLQSSRKPYKTLPFLNTFKRIGLKLELGLYNCKNSDDVACLLKETDVSAHITFRRRKKDNHMEDVDVQGSIPSLDMILGMDTLGGFINVIIGIDSLARRMDWPRGCGPGVAATALLREGEGERENESKGKTSTGFDGHGNSNSGSASRANVSLNVIPPRDSPNTSTSPSPSPTSVSLSKSKSHSASSSSSPSHSTSTSTSTPTSEKFTRATRRILPFLNLKTSKQQPMMRETPSRRARALSAYHSDDEEERERGKKGGGDELTVVSKVENAIMEAMNDDITSTTTTTVVSSSDFLTLGTRVGSRLKNSASFDGVRVEPQEYVMVGRSEGEGGGGEMKEKEKEGDAGHVGVWINIDTIFLRIYDRNQSEIESMEKKEKEKEKEKRTDSPSPSPTPTYMDIVLKYSTISIPSAPANPSDELALHIDVEVCKIHTCSGINGKEIPFLYCVGEGEGVGDKFATTVIGVTMPSKLRTNEYGTQVMDIEMGPIIRFDGVLVPFTVLLTPSSSAFLSSVGLGVISELVIGNSMGKSNVTLNPTTATTAAAVTTYNPIMMRPVESTVLGVVLGGVRVVLSDGVSEGEGVGVGADLKCRHIDINISKGTHIANIKSSTGIKDMFNSLVVQCMKRVKMVCEKDQGLEIGVGEEGSASANGSHSHSHSVRSFSDIFSSFEHVYRQVSHIQAIVPELSIDVLESNVDVDGGKGNDVKINVLSIHNVQAYSASNPSPALLPPSPPPSSSPSKSVSSSTMTKAAAQPPSVLGLAVPLIRCGFTAHSLHIMLCVVSRVLERVGCISSDVGEFMDALNGKVESKDKKSVEITTATTTDDHNVNPSPNTSANANMLIAIDIEKIGIDLGICSANLALTDISACGGLWEGQIRGLSTLHSVVLKRCASQSDGEGDGDGEYLLLHSGVTSTDFMNVIVSGQLPEVSHSHAQTQGSQGGSHGQSKIKLNGELKPYVHIDGTTLSVSPIDLQNMGQKMFRSITYVKKPIRSILKVLKLFEFMDGGNGLEANEGKSAVSIINFNIDDILSSINAGLRDNGWSNLHGDVLVSNTSASLSQVSIELAQMACRCGFKSDEMFSFLLKLCNIGSHVSDSSVIGPVNVDVGVDIHHSVENSAKDENEWLVNMTSNINEIKTLISPVSFSTIVSIVQDLAGTTESLVSDLQSVIQDVLCENSDSEMGKKKQKQEKEEDVGSFSLEHELLDFKQSVERMIQCLESKSAMKSRDGDENELSVSRLKSKIESLKHELDLELELALLDTKTKTNKTKRMPMPSTSAVDLTSRNSRFLSESALNSKARSKIEGDGDGDGSSSGMGRGSRNHSSFSSSSSSSINRNRTRSEALTVLQ